MQNSETDLPEQFEIQIQKRCNNCFKTKPLSEFYRKLHSYQSRCKPCSIEVSYCYRNKNHPTRVEKYLERREQLAFKKQDTI